MRRAGWLCMDGQTYDLIDSRRRYLKRDREPSCRNLVAPFFPHFFPQSPPRNQRASTRISNATNTTNTTVKFIPSSIPLSHSLLILLYYQPLHQAPRRHRYRTNLETAYFTILAPLV